MLQLDDEASGRLQPTRGDQVFLLPGQWYFGHAGETVKTLLGSCVAITLWHPQRRIGGMCHFLLPNRRRRSDGRLDGRFGDEAMALLVREVEVAGTHTEDYEVHVFGGADTMPDQLKDKLNIGERNVERAWALIDAYGFQLQSVDVGGNEPRSLTMDLGNGEVVLKRGPLSPGKSG